MQVSDNKVAFTPMYFVFLELDKHQCDLDFRLLDKNNNPVITQFIKNNNPVIHKDILSTAINPFIPNAPFL